MRSATSVARPRRRPAASRAPERPQCATASASVVAKNATTTSDDSHSMVASSSVSGTAIWASAITPNASRRSPPASARQTVLSQCSRARVTSRRPERVGRGRGGHRPRTRARPAVVIFCHVGTRARCENTSRSMASISSRICEYRIAGGADAAARPAGEQVDAGVGVAVQLAGAVDLEAHERAELGRGGAGLERRLGAEAADVLLGHVDAVAVEVLVDVAEEVGELERVAELVGPVRRRRRRGVRGSAASSRR